MRFYERQRLPVFAPPAAAFPIAWSVNGICLLAGLLHVLKLPKSTPGRGSYLAWQSFAWLLFASFNKAYFGLRSPINAALITVLYTGATLASLQAAIKHMRDPAAAWWLSSTLAWLALANPVGLTQAAWNRDEFWKAGPFFEPPAKLLKRR